MNKEILEVVARLVTIEARLGRRVLRDAAQRAILGIAVAAHVEAERRARKKRGGQVPRRTSVVPFPLDRTRRPDEGEDL